MCGALAHRGPDDTGIEVIGGNERGRSGPIAVLGHRRLSIIDLEGGHQPLSNEDASIWTVYNGEIYNFERFRHELIRREHELRTKCDTECLVHLYEERGGGLVNELRGMFAYGIWDDPQKILTLARDRLGQKPLFYSYDQQKGLFAFASELKALIEMPGFRRDVSRQALSDFLTFQYVPHPQCIFAAARKLPPAHILKFDAETGRLDLQRYWRPRFVPDHSIPRRERREQLFNELETATRLRLMSDVPLGAFLSGGVDSSIVVALMSRLIDQPVRTFSIGFENPRFDESAPARRVARHCGTRHRMETVRPRALDLLPELVWHYDEPFGDSSAIPTYYVSQLAREDVKVVLTGDAGDECFAGYPRYAAARIGQLFDQLPDSLRRIARASLWENLPTSVQAKTPLRRLKKLLLALSRAPQNRYLNWVSIFDRSRKTKLFTPELCAAIDQDAPEAFLSQYYGELDDEDFVHSTTYVDLMTYLPCDLLTKVDIASMAHGLEARSPFLDHRVIELAGQIPIRQKLRMTERGIEGKMILKETFGHLLPRPIVKRPKMGFGVPIGDWFRGELHDFARDILLARRCLERGYFREAGLRGLIDEHVAEQADHGYRLWSLLMLELWHRRFVDDRETGL